MQTMVHKYHVAYGLVNSHHYQAVPVLQYYRDVLLVPFPCRFVIMKVQ